MKDLFRIGIDLGGTKIEGIILDQDNREIIRKRIDTQQEKGYEHILNNVASLYHVLAEKIVYEQHTFGIGAPGAVSAKGLLKNSNTLCLNGKPFKADLERKLSRKINIENDANCFAMAEAIMGAGKNKDLVFGVIMGTGCGGGIVYKGEVFKGIQSIAGEWGHTSIDPSGPYCYCGKRGCVETFISGGGLEKLFKEQSGTEKRLSEIISQAAAGHLSEINFINQFYERFGIALANLINVLDPDVVILGGGLSNIDGLYTEGVDRVRKNVFNDELLTPIVKNLLGDSAGVIGAALIGI